MANPTALDLSAVSACSIRQHVRPDDAAAVRTIAASTGFFSDEEVDIAVELLDDALERGESSDYRFLIADVSGRPGGFASYGRVECTQGSYDLYWIAVHRDHQRAGIGGRLLDAVEQAIAAEGGRRIYVETSARAQYEPTLAFYQRCGYRIDAVLDDFYAPGDGKIILVKIIR